MNKKAVSLMVSYVLLISIVIFLSLGVYAFMKLVVDDLRPSAQCKEGTSIILEDYSCGSGGFSTDTLSLNLKNNGLFNISGIVLTVGDNPLREPSIKLLSKDILSGSKMGYYTFNNGVTPKQISPGELTSVEFSQDYIDSGGVSQSLDLTTIQTIQIQAFINTEAGIVICSDSLIKQDIEDCSL